MSSPRKGRSGMDRVTGVKTDGGANSSPIGGHADSGGSGAGSLRSFHPVAPSGRSSQAFQAPSRVADLPRAFEDHQPVSERAPVDQSPSEPSSFQLGVTEAALGWRTPWRAGGRMGGSG